jgi:two-component system OmpR family sensor kinase
VLVALAGFTYVAFEAKATQRNRTASENAAHTREVLLHMVEIADDRAHMRKAAAELETVRKEMFRELDYHSRVRLRVWKDGALVFNSLPELPDVLPAPRTRPTPGSARPSAMQAADWWSSAVMKSTTNGC